MVGDMKPTLYLETTIPSYYTALPSRDIVVLAHQEITREWWNVCISQYEIFVSELVIQEALCGDPDAAKRRTEAISLFPVLEILPEAERLAGIYLRKIWIILSPGTVPTSLVERSGKSWNRSTIWRGLSLRQYVRQRS